MSNQGISLKIDPEKFTIELSEAKKVMSEPKVGNYLILGKVYRPDTNELVDARLLIVPDGGFEN